MTNRFWNKKDKAIRYNFQTNQEDFKLGKLYFCQALKRFGNLFQFE